MSVIEPLKEPITISLIGDRYLLFDVNDATYLRRAHNICGVLIGSIPQVPQQNVFLGLPVELLPEEANLLVTKGVAIIVDDATRHLKAMERTGRGQRKLYLDSIRNEGLKARKEAEDQSRRRAERGLAKQALLRAKKGAKPPDVDSGASITEERARTPIPENSELKAASHEEVGPRDASRSDLSRRDSSSVDPYAVTPTTSDLLVPPPDEGSQSLIPTVPTSYALFAHLHDREYFITPGLRFGCDYTVYPGDPLRFHSHFLAVGYGWKQDIPLLDIIGGGRLGTGVKKGFLIGGEDGNADEKKRSVRTFCIEWGGM